MENETLTTGDENLQVNSDSQEESVEQEQTEQVAETVTTDSESEAYDKAWDDIDVNDMEQLNSMSNEPTDSEKAPEGFFNEADEDSLSDTKDDTKAFMVDKPVLKYKGKDIPIDSQEELIALAQKGFKMETEMANIKPKKKALSIIDGIPLEVLQAVSDIHSGNKEAISYIKEQYGIADADDNQSSVWGTEELPEKESETYTPDVREEDPMEALWSEYSSSNIKSASIVSELYQGLDDSFRSEIYKPDVFPAFISSVESGEFDKAYPIAIKEKSLNPAISWLQAYAVAVGKIGEVQTSRNTEPPASAVAPSSKSPRNISSADSADRVWNDTEYFNELERKLFN